MVSALDVAAGKKFEDGAADLDEIAVLQRALVDEFVVDVGAVGRSEVANPDHASRVHDLRVRARHRLLIDLNVRLGGASDDQRRRFQVVLATEVRPIDDHQARLLGGRVFGDLVDAGDDRFGPNVIGIDKAVGWFGRNPWQVKLQVRTGPQPGKAALVCMLSQYIALHA